MKIDLPKHITLYLMVSIIILPILDIFLAPANTMVSVFVLYFVSFIRNISTTSDTVYAEYKLVKGYDPTTFKDNLWLISVIIGTSIETTCWWGAILSVHKFLPIQKNTLPVFYISILFILLTRIQYITCYRKWVTSTQDTNTFLPTVQ